MRPRDFLPDELKGVRSAPVPFTLRPGTVRADENGRLWRRKDDQWLQLGAGPGVKIDIRPPEAGGKRVQVLAYKAVCMAWHGAKPKHWCVRFRNRNRNDLRPSNLQWVEKRTGRPRKMSVRDQREARERAEKGETLTALAEEYGVCLATMTNLCKGYVRRGESVAATAHHGTLCPPEQRAEAVRQCRAGRKVMAVARRFGISTNWLRVLVRRAEQEEQSQCSSSAST